LGYGPFAGALHRTDLVRARCCALRVSRTRRWQLAPTEHRQPSFRFGSVVAAACCGACGPSVVCAPLGPHPLLGVIRPLCGATQRLGCAAFITSQ
jgi:hypothetical protein